MTIDELVAYSRVQAHKGVCDGSCEEHRGQTVPVFCTHPYHNNPYLYFSYCEEAIDEDTRRGFTVEII